MLHLQDQHQHHQRKVVCLDLADSRVLRRPIAYALQPCLLVHSAAGFIGPQISASSPKTLTLNLINTFGILHLSQIMPLPLLNDHYIFSVDVWGLNNSHYVYMHYSISISVLKVIVQSLGPPSPSPSKFRLNFFRSSLTPLRSQAPARTQQSLSVFQNTNQYMVCVCY